eukprot:CAMPEP_0183747920 /NCGR_PEP_ID=MMETSP0737-20130205/67507_1 /TAXON_ID=385413 /ORGANISM="Thalassiosira miniscula, Strain CCMP1093" /LENGTH=348 /DNA_ID=CAMNT_0025983637 /DNA_START=42 /DNA_END=1084 /DNA_ORIENTATION=-
MRNGDSNAQPPRPSSPNDGTSSSHHSSSSNNNATPPTMASTSTSRNDNVDGMERLTLIIPPGPLDAGIEISPADGTCTVTSAARKNSPLQEGDVITSINGMDLEDVTSAARKNSPLQEGDVITSINGMDLEDVRGGALAYTALFHNEEDTTVTVVVHRRSSSSESATAADSAASADADASSLFVRQRQQQEQDGTDSEADETSSETSSYKAFVNFLSSDADDQSIVTRILRGSRSTASSLIRGMYDYGSGASQSQLEAPSSESMKSSQNIDNATTTGTGSTDGCITSSDVDADMPSSPLATARDGSIGSHRDESFFVTPNSSLDGNMMEEGNDGRSIRGSAVSSSGER